MRLFELWIQLDGSLVMVDSVFLPALDPQSYSPTDLCFSGPGVSLQRLLQIVRCLFISARLDQGTAQVAYDQRIIWQDFEGVPVECLVVLPVADLKFC